MRGIFKKSGIFLAAALFAAQGMTAPISTGVPAGGGGSGTVTAFSAGGLSPLFTSAVATSTTTPALTFTLVSQTANTMYAGPTTGSATAPSFRALVGTDLPNPSASTLGGIESIASVSHQFLTAISTSGVPAQAQPSTNDLSDIASFNLSTTGTATLNSGGSVGTGADFAIGTASVTGSIKHVYNGPTGSYFGIYNSSTSKYYALAPQIPAAAGISALGGYYNGMAIGGTTNTGGNPIFGVLNSTQSGNGLNAVAFTVYDNNKTLTFHNTLDDGSGNAIFVDGLTLSGIGSSSTGDYLCSNGGVITAGTSVCTLSSRRWKDHIDNIPEGALNKVMAMRPVNFRYKKEYGDHGTKEHGGFIAEEAAKIVPDDVVYGADGKPSGFNYPEYTAYLTKAVQEQQKQIEGLTQENKGVFPFHKCFFGLLMCAN